MATVPTFKDWVVETSSTTGTGPYLLGGPPPGTSYFTFRGKYANGNSKVAYWVRNVDRTKWEKNRFATLTYGTPDTLTRSPVDSTNGGAAVSWVSGDLPLTIYVAPDSDAAEIAISGGAAGERNSASKEMAPWADNTAGYSGRVPVTVKPASTEIEIGAWEGAAGPSGVYVPSRRWPVLAVGAANLTLTAAHIGWWITFNTTAAQRSATLPSGATIGAGYTVRLQALDDVFPLAVIPNGSDAINAQANSTTFYAQGVHEFDVTWTGTKWRTSNAREPLLIERSGFTGTVTLQNFGIGSINFLEFDYYAKSAIDVAFTMTWYNSGGGEVTSGYNYNVGGWAGATFSGSQASSQSNMLLMFTGQTSDGATNWGYNLTGKITPMNSTTRATHLNFGCTYVEGASGLYTKVIGDATSNDLSARTGIKIAATQTISDARITVRGRP